MSDSVTYNAVPIPPTLRERVRLRPAMYIGGTDRRGYHHLLEEVMDNAVQEVMNGYCTEVTLTLHDSNTITVEDNGRGIPVDPIPDTGRPFLEHVLVSRAPEITDEYRVRVGVHCVGIAAVNALCERFVAEVHRDGTHYRIGFARGVQVSDLAAIGPSDRSGTSITLTPDPEIFGDNCYFVPDVLCRYLSELACLNPEATFRFVDDTNGDRMTFHCPTGVGKLLEISQAPGSVWESDITCGYARQGDMQAWIALRESSVDWGTRSFVNGVRIDNDRADASWLDGEVRRVVAGSDIRGLVSGIRQAVIGSARARGVDPSVLHRLVRRDFEKSFHAVISLRLLDPQIKGATRDVLVPSKKIRYLVRAVAADTASRHFEEHPDYIQRLLTNR